MSKHYVIQNSMMLGDARRSPVKRAKRICRAESKLKFKLSDEQADWMAKWYPFQFLVMAGMYDKDKGL